MNFPTIKKPKSNKQLESKLPSMNEVVSAKMGDMTNIQPTAKMGNDDSELAEQYEEFADRVKGSVGTDNSSKAEMLKARAMLVKSKASKMKGEEFDSYSKERGYYNSKKK